MKTLQFILKLSVVVASCGSIGFAAPDLKPPSYVETTDPKEATLSLTAKCTLAGVFAEKTQIAYFRPPRDENDRGFTGGRGSAADGPNGGLISSLGVKPKADVVDVTFGFSWTRPETNGRLSVTVPVQYIQDGKGGIAGLTYELTWKRLK